MKFALLLQVLWHVSSPFLLCGNGMGWDGIWCDLVCSGVVYRGRSLARLEWQEARTVPWSSPALLSRP